MLDDCHDQTEVAKVKRKRNIITTLQFELAYKLDSLILHSGLYLPLNIGYADHSHSVISKLLLPHPSSSIQQLALALVQVVISI